MSEKTTIQISKQTRDKLAGLAHNIDDTFEVVVRRLIESAGAQR